VHQVAGAGELGPLAEVHVGQNTAAARHAGVAAKKHTFINKLLVFILK